MSKLFIGRNWASHLIINVKSAATRAALIVQWHRQGQIDDAELWEILSIYNSPLSCKDAAAVYQVLGYVPHMGYPLTRL